ncbi:hypothetical protein AKO1_008794 [Acrasis kona]|uniref:NEDD8 ultimate buster 1 n=1 Tax=Acrasis kona TaxID=1008807 RepID=A0AAW2ZG22_9EUKA
MRLLAGGKFLKDDGQTLQNQNVKTSSKVLVLRKPKEAEPVAQLNQDQEQIKLKMQEEENKAKRIKSLRDAAERIASRKDGGTSAYEKYHFDLTDQNGRQFELPEAHRISLIMGMTLHQMGQKEMKNKQHKQALEIFNLADEEFRKLDTKILNMVDNYAFLNVDMVWCMYHISDADLLFSAKQRLALAERCLVNAHGPNLERLVRIKGPIAQERLLYARLHVLQAAVAHLTGQLEQSKILFEECNKEINRLIPNQSYKDALISMGFDRVESERTLRFTGNNLDRSISYMIEQRDKKALQKSESKKHHEKRKQRYRMGKIKNNLELVNADAAIQLQEMFNNEQENEAWTLAVMVEALRECNNNVEQAVVLLTSNRSLLEEKARKFVMSGRVKQVSKIKDLSCMGFHTNVVRFVLLLYSENEAKALEALLEAKHPLHILMATPDVLDDSTATTTTQQQEQIPMDLYDDQVSSRDEDDMSTGSGDSDDDSASSHDDDEEEGEDEIADAFRDNVSSHDLYDSDLKQEREICESFNKM